MNKLNKEERDILRSYKKGEWQPVKKMKSKIREHRAYAKATLNASGRLTQAQRGHI